MYTFSTELFSDLHKDVFGYRPRGHWFYDATTTDEERQAEWDYLCSQLEMQLAEDRERKDGAAEELEANIQLNLHNGAQDREQAIKWIVQSLDPDHIDLCYGGEWVCYSLGLDYSMDIIFKKACDELREELEMIDNKADQHYYAMSFQ